MANGEDRSRLHCRCCLHVDARSAFAADSATRRALKYLKRHEVLGLGQSHLVAVNDVGKEHQHEIGARPS